MIRNLLFDLGGVIMDIEKERCVQAFAELGLPDPSKFFGDFGQKGPFMLIEEGKIDADTFHSIIREMVPRPVTDEEMDHAFIRFLIGIPVERLRLLEKLHEHYNLFLLSNTNPIMWNTFIASEFRKDGHDIDYYFDGIVTSFEAKALKPAPEIFEYTVTKLGIEPEETIFFDDSEKNLHASEHFGFNVCHVTDRRDMAKCIDELHLL